MTLDRDKLIQLRASKKRSNGRPWRQIDAAAKAGVSLALYQRAESGLDVADVSAGQIANAYGVKLSDIRVKEQKSA